VRKRGTSRTPRQSGAASVELALLMPLLVLMFLGVADFGRAFYWVITLAHAARAGAQFGAQGTTNAANATGIRQAALDEAQNIGSIDVSSARICECDDGTVVDCATTPSCGSYGVPRVFVRVTTSTEFRTVVPYPGVPDTVSLSRTAILRLQ
jgi:Flp pilus assembly protein TadG